jgi:large subunit ribosomal protein L29
MKATELQELSEAELEDKLGELTEERFRLRFRSATESIEDTSTFRSMRRDIARIKTIQRQRQQAGQA